MDTIIPFIYGEAKHYYETQAKKEDTIAAAIKAQLEKDRIEIKYNPNDYIGQKKRKNKINLDEIGEE